ncbi:SapB/AmfS family lanthipeptide [Sinosporangium siamense]|nr:SapB/AmfS family lanthipeptide [Sinosporangium siamense]
MALLDLQGMENETPGGGPRSTASRHCGGGASWLSLLLC